MTTADATLDIKALQKTWAAFDRVAHFSSANWWRTMTPVTTRSKLPSPMLLIIEHGLAERREPLVHLVDRAADVGRLLGRERRRGGARAQAGEEQANDEAAEPLGITLRTKH